MAVSLNCWTLGLNKTSRFSVEILLSETVDHLKKAVKKEKGKENALSTSTPTNSKSGRWVTRAT